LTSSFQSLCLIKTWKELILEMLPLVKNSGSTLIVSAMSTLSPQAPFKRQITKSLPIPRTKKKLSMKSFSFMRFYAARQAQISSV